MGNLKEICQDQQNNCGPPQACFISWGQFPNVWRYILICTNRSISINATGASKRQIAKERRRFLSYRQVSLRQFSTKCANKYNNKSNLPREATGVGSIMLRHFFVARWTAALHYIDVTLRGKLCGCIKDVSARKLVFCHKWIFQVNNVHTLKFVDKWHNYNKVIRVVIIKS